MLPKHLSTVTAYVADRNRGPADFVLLSYVATVCQLVISVGKHSSFIRLRVCLLAVGCARTDAADVGIATAAIASINLLMALCDLGLATALIHYAAVDRARSTTVVTNSRYRLVMHNHHRNRFFGRNANLVAWPGADS